MRLRSLFLIAFLFTLISTAAAQTAIEYQKPPADIVKMMEAPPLPLAQVSPDHKWMLLSERSAMPSIADLAQPMLRLAGTRISPRSNSAFSVIAPQGINRLTLVDIATKKSRDIILPQNARIAYVSFSPDGRHIA